MSPRRPWPTPSSARPLTDGERYDQVARDAAGLVIGAYSSSFGLASRLLHEPVRAGVRDIYAFVRLADEIVDGPMGIFQPELASQALERLEEETVAALEHGYSSNLVVHAFAGTARRYAIDSEQIDPFISSMRTDLTQSVHDESSFAEYVHGSAEVVGLMCLKVFLDEGHSPGAQGALAAELEPGAVRLGAAFQKVNFLRDLAEDYQARGRRYFPGIDPEHLSEAEKHRLLDDIDADLAAAQVAVDRLPRSSRAAVAVAHALFLELSRRLRATPATTILSSRVRVPGHVKNRVAAAALLRARRS
ncbi:MAG: squalene/phytoene synthase family protein [Knoellia sp.]